jgi:type VI secretion system secreted protein Hcp
MSGANPSGAGAQQAPSCFLKIEEIKGEARPKAHENEIEVLSWSWGETQSVFPSETRKSGGSVTMRDFHFTARASSASPLLFVYCAGAKRIKSAVLTCEQDHKQGKHIYLTITFSNVVVSSYDVEGGSAGDRACDRVTLKFTKIELTYTPIKPDGTPGSNFANSWDLSLNSS